MILCYDFLRFVEILNGKYKGQKLTELVRINTILITTRTIPGVLITMFEKYKPASIMAIMILMILSIDPTFVFML